MRDFLVVLLGMGLVAAVVGIAFGIERLIDYRQRRRIRLAQEREMSADQVYPTGHAIPPTVETLQADLDHLAHSLRYLDDALRITHRRLSRIALALAILITILIVQHT